MNLTTFLISILILSTSSCKNTIETCKDFREGEFIYFNKQNNKFDNSSKTIRTGNKQIFIAPVKGDTLTYQINWKTGCKYELTLIESNKKPKPHMIQIGDKLLVEIEPVDKTTYNYKSRGIDSEFKNEFTGRMKKIK